MRLPGLSDRALILGRTGSGKTVGAVWHLAQKNLQSKAWIVLNHKGDSLIDSVPGAQMVDLNFIPKKPGLYIYHPVPERDDDLVTDLLWRIHSKENIGIYIDEAYMIAPRDPALVALYTQGRSKNIPMITVSQRPSSICRFAISEADFHQIYYLIDQRDRKTVNAFIPFDLETIMRPELGKELMLPEYHSVYYDVKKNDIRILTPVPTDDQILSLFDQKLNTQNGKKFLI